MKHWDLKKRCFSFSLEMVKFLKTLDKEVLQFIVIRQVLRSAVSVGANVIEAKNSSTRNEFRRYYEIALKSCNETKYWICVLRDGFGVDSSQSKNLLLEADEISKILAASILKLKNNT